MERNLYFCKTIFVIFSFAVLLNSSLEHKKDDYFSTNDDSQFSAHSISVSFHKVLGKATKRISIGEPLFTSRSLLGFLPPLLDFEQRYLGIPHCKKVTIVNLSCNKSVLMFSISGNTVHFYSSFFKDKLIPPLGNTSFNVVFLGKEESELKSYLYIHTSEGSFKYEVMGKSIDNPYHIRPFSGVKLPLNASYNPVILLHNPFKTPLQLTEVYSSGNEFQLELPSGKFAGPNQIWKIPGLLTQPIVKIKFDATIQRNHSAFIRLKIDKGDVLIFPVNVEVQPSYGLYAPDDLINFGIGKPDDLPKLIKLYLRNSWRNAITVQNITASPSSNPLKIEFHPVEIPPHHHNPTEVAVLIFDWNSTRAEGLKSGEIIVSSSHNAQKLVVSYKAYLCGPECIKNQTQAKYKLDESGIQLWPISIKNNLEVPIAITNVSIHQSISPYFKELNLKTDHYCIVQDIIPVSQEIGRQMTMVTEFKIIKIGLKFKIDYGSIEVITHPVEFNNIFSSAICSAELNVEPHFTSEMAATSVMNIPQHSRLGFLPSSSKSILPFTRAFFDHLAWNITGNSTGVHKVLDELELTSCTEVKDLSLLSMQDEHLKCASEDFSILFMWMNKNGPINSSLNTSVQPEWPSVLSISSKVIEFPLTQVGNISYKNFMLLNPSSKQPLVVQLFLEPSYSVAAGLINNFPSRLTPFNTTSYEPLIVHPENSFFIFLDKEIRLPHKKLVAFLLEPSTKIPITFAFKPERAEVSSSLLMIWNNLTVLEVVKVRGSGAYAQFKFGNRLPGSGTPLLFELSEKYLQICEREVEEKDILLNLTVRRSFIARNTGALQLTIIDFTISGYSCRGFGFRVLNCQPFILLPNTSRKIDITFTPDFTLSRITRVLTVLTLDASVNYTLTATLPPYMLSMCSSIVKRPSWEPLVYYSSVSFMLFLLICVLVASFFESNRILRNTIITLSKESNVQPVLDLRMIGSDVSGTERTTLQTESQCKIIWTSNSYREEQISKDIQKPISESIFTINCSNKCQILNNGINCKKKAERTICKRFSDGSENYIKKTCWETSFSRTNTSQLVKPLKTSICITTEPYIPLANIKTRDSSLQKHKFGSSTKFEQSRFIELQPCKSKKKSHSLHSYDISKKKTVNLIPMRSIFEECESSTTSESTSSDGEKDVESMFFQSVRHHLQSKVARSRHLKLSGSSPLTKRKKPLEKSVGNILINEWDLEEEDTSDKTPIVRNSRRTTPTVKQLKKQTVNYGKLRYEQSQSRGKQNIGERGMKSSLRKDKAQSAKKRNERFEKRVASVKATTLMVAQACSIPSPPVWTASFSDVVAGTDISYSSVVATRHSASSQKHYNNACTRDSGNSSSSNVKNFPADWKSEYQDAVEHLQQESSPNECTSAAESKRPFNSIWGNWSSISESVPAPNHASANSLFTDSSQWINSNTKTVAARGGFLRHVLINPPEDELNTDINRKIVTIYLILDALMLMSSLQNLAHQVANYEPLRTDQGILKVLHNQQQEIEGKPSLHGIRNEISWPVITSLWEPLYTPSSAVDTPPPVWGSDVWGPPVTPPPNSTHTEEVIQSCLDYDPFKSLSNIWSQHSPNIWKPPSTE